MIYTLKTVTVLGFLSNNVKNGINKLCSLSVVTLGPVVTSTRLAKHKVIRPEDLAIGTGPNAVHGTRLKVHEHSTRHKSTTGRLVIVDIDTLQLKLGVSGVSSGGINAVFITDDFPELGSNLVSTLSTLNVKDFSHFLSADKKK